MTELDLERLVVFDLETTGLEADCKIVQIAIIRGERIFQSLVNPGRPIPPESTAIHRITDEDVADAPIFETIVDEVLAFMADGVLAGFNIRKFDVPVLKREVRQVGRTFPPLPMLDLFELNQKMNPRTLAWFYHHYTGEEMDKAEAHDAVYDCICTRKGFLAMYQKHEELPLDLESLVPFAEPERVSIGGSSWFVWVANQCEPSFARGKYLGWALSDVARKEPSYLHWLGTIDADPATKNIVHLYQTNQSGYIEFLREEHPLRLEPRYLEFRQAMDRDNKQAFHELLKLAGKTGDPSLSFLSAAWASRNNMPEARSLAQTYLEMEDPNVNSQRRANFLKKTMGF